MLKSFLKLGAMAVLAAAIAVAPTQLVAQTTNKAAGEKKPAAAKKESAGKKKSAHPFRGKLAEVDKTAKTIKVGQSIYQVTSETKITKDGKPATLEDGVVGEPVSGYAKPTEDGKMAAATVRFGGRSEEKGGDKSADKKKKDK